MLVDVLLCVLLAEFGWYKETGRLETVKKVCAIANKFHFVPYYVIKTLVGTVFSDHHKSSCVSYNLYWPVTDIAAKGNHLRTKENFQTQVCYTRILVMQYGILISFLTKEIENSTVRLPLACEDKLYSKKVS